MKAIILAAGYATRLYPITENFPKPLLDIGGTTILDALIDNASKNNMIDSYIIISNHKFVSFFEDFAKRRKEKISVYDDGSMENDKRLGAVNDLKLAFFGECDGAPYIYEKMETNDDMIFVAAGDNVLDFSLENFFKFAKEKDTSVVMCHKEDDLQKKQKTAIITVDENDKITSYEEKPLEPKGNLAVPPFYIYKAKDLALLREALDDGCGYDAPGSFAAWLSGKRDMHAFKMNGKRIDVGDLNSLNAIRKMNIDNA